MFQIKLGIFYYWLKLMPLLISKQGLFLLENIFYGEILIKFYHQFCPLPLRQDIHCFAKV